MNVPVSPPVDLRNLKDLAASTAQGLETLEKPSSRAIVLRRRSRAKPIAAAGLGVMAATGVLAWRSITADLGRRAARRNGALLAGGLGLVAIGVAAWQLQRLFTPSPSYEVELHDGAFELRRYPALQVAETTVDERWNAALEEGFRRLAGFIFGENTAQQKIAMTTPVLGTGDDDGFKVSFILPQDVLVPTPSDDRIALKNMPARRVAVLRFHGRYSVENLEAHKRELAHELVVRGLEPMGEAMFAGYDPPSTLPILRRTELWVDVG